jgi:hypothetical protein
LREVVREDKNANLLFEELREREREREKMNEQMNNEREVDR